MLTLTAGCASSRKKPAEVAGPTPQGPPISAPTSSETFGPPMPPVQPTYGPELQHARPVVLVLGPGLARGFVFAGVLRALREKKIPVGAILGTEMGGLIAALYGTSKNLNQFEWALLRVKEEFFVVNEGFLARLGSNDVSRAKKLQAFLDQTFEKKDLKDSKIPLRISVQAAESGVPMLLDQGSIAAAIRGTLANPTLFSPSPWQAYGQTIPIMSSAQTRPFPIEEAKALAIGPVIAIDVTEDSALAQDELKGADLVVRPDLNGIQYKDFKKRTEAAYRGKKAILEHETEIRRLISDS